MLDGLAAYERRHGWQGNLKNIMSSGGVLEKYQHPDWSQPPPPGSYIHALVLAATPETATLKFGSYTAEISGAEVAWTHHKSPREILSPGDIAYMKILSLNHEEHTARVSLEQDSGAQAALLAIDNATGEIKAMVGGRDFQESKFNRATQAVRQVGSSFKPFVYTAAVDQGADPDDLILDAPTTFNSGGVPYSPHNFDYKFKGNITLRYALAESRNVPAVKLAQKVGMASVVDYARRFGITSPIPALLPVALGAADLSLYEQTSAYSVFPNDGVRIEPHYIVKVMDYEGHVLEQTFPDAKDVVSAHTARTMVSLLQSVVQYGTAASAAKLKHPLAGKTGTTNDYTDAWFVGFSPGITCGVWTGFDEKKTLGPKETGGQAALPIWIDFMRTAIADPARKDEAFLTGDEKTAPVLAVKKPETAAPIADAEAH